MARRIGGRWRADDAQGASNRGFVGRTDFSGELAASRMPNATCLNADCLFHHTRPITGQNYRSHATKILVFRVDLFLYSYSMMTDDVASAGLGGLVGCALL